MNSLFQNGTANQEKNKGHFRKSIEKKKEKMRLKDASVLFALEVIVQFELSMPNSDNTYGMKEIFPNNQKGDYLAATWIGVSSESDVTLAAVLFLAAKSSRFC